MAHRTARFPRTRWSLVQRASAKDGGTARAALEEICTAYWYPLYAFARRRGHSAHDAEDATQEFFGRLMTQQLLSRADPQRRRLRSFLLRTVQHHLSEQNRREDRLKRGGGARIVPLDSVHAESWYECDRIEGASDELFFDRSWARAVLRHALRRVEADYGRRGYSQNFRVLRNFLEWQGDEASFIDASHRLGLSVESTRVAVHRLRDRFRRALIHEVGQTVTDAADIDAECRHLLRVLAA